MQTFNPYKWCVVPVLCVVLEYAWFVVLLAVKP